MTFHKKARLYCGTKRKKYVFIKKTYFSTSWHCSSIEVYSTDDQGKGLLKL